MSTIEVVVTIACSVFASSGFWVIIQKLLDRKDAKTKLLVGIGHNLIVSTGMKFIERGWVTKDEYEDLRKYLYDPYKKNGGDGTAEKVMKEVDKLPIHEYPPINRENV